MPHPNPAIAPRMTAPARATTDEIGEFTFYQRDSENVWTEVAPDQIVHNQDLRVTGSTIPDWTSITCNPRIVASRILGTVVPVLYAVAYDAIDDVWVVNIPAADIADQNELHVLTVSHNTACHEGTRTVTFLTAN
jgi:hypothetical protein